MRSIVSRHGKTLFIAVATVLVVGAMAASGVFALGSAPAPTPPPATGSLADLRLEVAWARLQAAHERLQIMLDFAGQHTAAIQNLLDQAQANGKDVSAIQAALSKLEAAIKQAQPIFDGTTATINAHPGFDDKGGVADPTTAAQTVQGVSQHDQQIMSTVGPAQQAFQQALVAFRQSGGSGVYNAEAADLRLELAWARLQASHARLEVFFDFADQRTSEVQQLIDRAQAAGKDVSGVQSALDNLEQAIKQAKPLFEGMSGTLASHQGFDNAGNVTDASKALQTVKDLAATEQQIGSILTPAQQALKDAIDAYRQTNQASPTPSD